MKCRVGSLDAAMLISLTTRPQNFSARQDREKMFSEENMIH
jgi:hypothetical protein